MIPKLIHFIVPPNMNPRQHECINRARSLHPGWTVHVWNDTVEIQGARLSSYISRANSGAQRADLLRLDIVFSFGGVYLDSDMYLLKPLDQLLVYDKFVICSEDGAHLSNGFFAATPQHDTLDALITYLNINEPDWALPPNITTGPILFSQILRYREDTVLLPRETFYPYNNGEARPDRFLPATIAVHEWAGSWVKRSHSSREPRTISHYSKAPLKWLFKKIQPIAKKVVGGILPQNLVNSIEFRPASYPTCKEIIALTRNNVMMSLPGDDLSVAPSLALTGQFEPAEEKFARNIIRGGDWVVDVGANLGLYSLIAASRCGPFGRVFAIEPDEGLCLHMQRSILLNWFQDRMSIWNIAVTDSDVELFLQASPTRRGDQQVTTELPAIPDDGQERTNKESCLKKVGGKTLEQLFPVDLPIKLLKIDVEGHEIEALKGARRLFERRCIQFMLIEMSPENHGVRYGELLKIIKELLGFGYSLKRITEDGFLVESDSESTLFPFHGHTNVVLELCM
jgi:FkbM family methyltransferase